MTAATDLILKREGLPAHFARTVDRFYKPLALSIVRLEHSLKRTAVIGICGAQGSGKSTLALFLEAMLRERGERCAVLSIDDLYLTRAERQELARKVHPLFITRGPPGTHDIAMGLTLLERLAAAAPKDETPLPRFDKSRDERAPEASWPRFKGRADIILFDGWCIGARAQDEAALEAPLNALEREHDAQGLWRRAVNEHLKGDYQKLFARLDALVLLKVPSFEKIAAWRALQEEKLARTSPGAPGLMTPPEIARFIMHYERITRWSLDEMPARADAVLTVGADHAITGLDFAARGRLSPP